MTQLTRILALSTALGMILAVPALADSNFARLHQTGDGNTATIDQNGNNNMAGANYLEYSLRQTGDNNAIDIYQEGAGNGIGVNNQIAGFVTGGVAGFNGLSAGTKARALAALGGTYPALGASGTPDYRGVQQIGDHNALTVDQFDGTTYNDGNSIGAVRQQGSATATALTNSLTITQGNASQLGSTAFGYHYMGDVNQNNTGSGTSAADANVAAITQLNGGYSLGNKVIIVTQSGIQHGLTVTQDGENNLIVKTEQTGTDSDATLTQTGNRNLITIVDQDGTGNTANLSFDGSDNGAGVLTGEADIAGLTDSAVYQSGTGNQIDLSVIGSSNQFGFFQDGISNEVGLLTVNGDFNEVGIYQTGTDNQVALGTIDGNGNNVGVFQDGTNLATIDIHGATSNDNDIGVSQIGTNIADVDVTGSTNLLSISQNGDNNGVGQGVKVVINGSGNNSAGAGSFASPLFDAALTASSLAAGDIVQNGNNNSVDIQVGNLTPGSDNNLFAFRQQGNSNTLVGTINGDANQALVFQNGSSNTTNFTQNGGNNYAVVTQ
jgi:hypothetical protein